MTEYETLLVEREDGVAIITLNRPKVLNAMNTQLNGELHDAIAATNGDHDIGCIVITGSGEKAFTAGGDIHEQRENDAKFSEADLDAKRELYMNGAYEISTSKKPTIGMMNGLAYGGGAVLASSLDMRIGCEDTKFRFLAAAYGRINSTWTLPNQVGWPMAKELLFSARIVEAEEAYRIGLLNHLVPKTELRQKTMELAKIIAGNHTGAVTGVKELMLRGLGEDLRTQWEHEIDYGKNVMRGAKAEDAFPDFIARKGREFA
ncbi:MAG: Short-chain-enoyl-CoA hydratase [Alphaproteobacteria bacterium MarineAlpha4_Bin2]|nr:MAG: Short-chain-enoyl-CoA hydratase [Alphaproteobacteria bacterium MarineAlpha4_Bin2]